MKAGGSFITLRELLPVYGRPVKIRMDPVGIDGNVTNPGVASQILRELGCRGPEESVGFLFLNARNAIVNYWVASAGGVDECPVYPDAVLRRAILSGSNRIIMAHNHPSGNIDPSSCDKTLVRRLSKAFDAANFTLVDSMVLADNGGYYSFRQEGLIDRLDREN